MQTHKNELKEMNMVLLGHHSCKRKGQNAQQKNYSGFLTVFT